MVEPKQQHREQPRRRAEPPPLYVRGAVAVVLATLPALGAGGREILELGDEVDSLRDRLGNRITALETKPNAAPEVLERLASLESGQQAMLRELTRLAMALEQASRGR